MTDNNPEYFERMAQRADLAFRNEYGDALRAAAALARENAELREKNAIGDAAVAHAQRQAAAELFKGTDMMEAFDACVATILRTDFGIEE